MKLHRLVADLPETYVNMLDNLAKKHHRSNRKDELMHLISEAHQSEFGSASTTNRDGKTPAT